MLPVLPSRRVSLAALTCVKFSPDSNAFSRVRRRSPKSTSAPTAEVSTNQDKNNYVNDSKHSGLFQLGVLLDQLLQSKARKLYRNLRLFAFSLAMVDRSFSIFRMPHLLPRSKTATSFGLFDRHFCHAEFLSARGEEFGNVVDGVVFGSGRFAAGLDFIAPCG